MIITGTNIISSLGFTTDENFDNVKRGISGVKRYEQGTFDLPEAFMASLIDKERLNDEWAACRGAINRAPTATTLEKAAILSVFNANKEAKIDLSSEKTIFILSTTKGNVENLDMRLLDMRYETEGAKQEKCDCLKSKSEAVSNLKSQIYLWHSAKTISQFFENKNTPIVVSNACVSGACAQITAMRELESGKYENAVVVGADFLSKFIISGFQSFKALSPELCKPFDTERCGLNLGEAAATIIFQYKVESIKYKVGEHQPKTGTPNFLLSTNDFLLINGAIRNDAIHISAPSRVGEGSFRALNYLLSNNLISNSLLSEISFINAHGTATPYNDSMEAQAIFRAGLQNVSVNSLKPFFGHTLGAAGVLESIISMKALQNNIILPTLNFKSQNFENQLNISTEIQKTDKKYFIKMLSGFGGVNTALLFEVNSHEYTNKHE